MPPPPVTPSPHRFVTKPQKPPPAKPLATPSTEKKAPATPHPQTKKQLPKFAATPIAQQKPSSTNAAQFVATPRFSFARPPSPKRPRLNEPEHFATPRRFVNEYETKDQVCYDEDEEEDTQQVTRPSFHSSVIPSIQDSEAIPLHNSRPVFLQPPQEPVEQSSPLPEAFSPHRRGQKFVPGGMASEVRQWILDTTQLSSRKPNSAGELWRIRVIECRGSAKEGCVLVRGDFDGRDVRLILPGAGKGKDVHVGEVIGIKGPTWEVELEGVKWVVAADWNIIKEHG